MMDDADAPTLERKPPRRHRDHRDERTYDGERDYLWCSVCSVARWCRSVKRSQSRRARRPRLGVLDWGLGVGSVAEGDLANEANFARPGPGNSKSEARNAKHGGLSVTNVPKKANSGGRPAIGDWRLRIGDWGRQASRMLEPRMPNEANWAGDSVRCGGRYSKRSQYHNGESVGEFFFFSVLLGRRWWGVAWRRAVSGGRWWSVGGFAVSLVGLARRGRLGLQVGVGAAVRCALRGKIWDGLDSGWRGCYN
jgi:hypothetical protein